MRNSDYSPTRFIAQTESVNDLVHAKLKANVQSQCSVLSMAGERITTHVTLTRDVGKLMNTMANESKIGGYSNFLAGMKTAQLVLKHRQNKSLNQRIIMFVGSPIEHTDKELTKNNISVDVINFGDENTSENKNVEKLEALVGAVNSEDTSHLINIPPGPHLLSDMIASSPVVLGAAAGGGGGSAFTPEAPASSNSAFGGVDPNQDPELAAALRMSMEEERARQQRATDAALAASKDTATPMDVVEEE